MVWYHFPPRGTNLVERKGTKMLIKFDVTTEEGDRLKMQYGQKVASKAFRMAASDAFELYRKNQELHEVIDSQRTKIRMLRHIIEQARSSAAQLLEKTSQGDLLDV